MKYNWERGCSIICRALVLLVSLSAVGVSGLAAAQEKLPPGVKRIPPKRVVKPKPPAKPQSDQSTEAIESAESGQSHQSSQTVEKTQQAASEVTTATRANPLNTLATEPAAEANQRSPQVNQPTAAPVSESKDALQIDSAKPASPRPIFAPGVTPVSQKQNSVLPAGVTARPRVEDSYPSSQAEAAAEAAAALSKDKGELMRPGRESRGGGLLGSLTVRPDARTMSLAVPAPRGQITDRNGKPFAQSKVAWYPALKFGQFEKAERSFVIEWANKRIAQANKIFQINWTVSDENLWQHYRHRRWLAMPVTHVVDEARKKEIEGSLMPGLVLHPIYMRYYPEKESAAHIVGYVGSSGKLEKGPINYGDPIFKFSEGRAGLEKLFDEVLTGKPGLLRQDYEADGTEVVKKFESRPKPGGTVVTTLDLDWQKKAEEVLENHCSRGAFVVIDIHTGEVLAMASRPGFDLNDFIPFISTEKYEALKGDPGTPLFARSFQGAYPPASTFKPVVALAALNNRDISERSLIYCPAAIRIGKHWFRNWTTEPEGDIDVKRAIARSCNTWFYQVGIMSGPSAFLSVARRLGYGSKTGLPLIGETAGLVPNNTWMKKHHGRTMTDGDTANLSIGQGAMLASPLQVAQAMAGIARGNSLPRLHLVKQIQDVGGRVLVSNEPQRRNYLNIDPMAAEVVQEGMMQVVNAGYGTGQRGGLSYTVVCGKTGTAQWGPESLEKRLAWFSGYFPQENPRFAFAALYEGKPHEKLSGGRKAAPMVSSFFEYFKKDIQILIAPPPKALVIEEDDEGEDQGYILGDIEDAPRAVLVEEDEDDGGLDPAMALPNGLNNGGRTPDGFIPNRNPIRPMTPPPAANPWRGQNPPPASRAIPVEEDPVDSPPTGRLPMPPRRAIPVDE